MASGKEMRVGLVFFAGLAVLFAMTVFIGRGELRIHRGYYNIDVLFENIQGLRPNDTVELSGMEIGRVDSLAIEDGLIRVRLRIDSQVRIREDSTITIAEKSLIGGKMVSATMGSPEAPFLAPGSTVRGETAPTPLELVKQASTFGERLEEVLSGIDSSIPEFASLVESLNRIAAGVEEGRGTIGKLMTEDELYEDITETVKSTRQAAGEVAKWTEQMERLRTYLGVDTAYNENTSRTLTKIYLRLEPRPDKLYLIGGSALTGRGTEWDEKDKASFELDIQIGKRWLDERLTGRVGVFESRFGAGLDYAPGGRISATIEARDVWTKEYDEGIKPFLVRGRVNLKAFRGVYLHAGLDNMLDDPGLNAGIRLEYSDEDLKYLVGILSLGR